MNEVTLSGRLVRDPQLQYTPNQKAVLSTTLAVERLVGEQTVTDFVPCIIWGKDAEHMSEYTKKGSRISLNGYIKTRKYQNKAGAMVYVTEVHAITISVL